MESVQRGRHSGLVSVYSHHSSARATSGCSKSWSPGTTPELFLSNSKTESTQYELRIMGGGIYTPIAHALNRTPSLKNGFFRGMWQAWLDQEEPSHALSAPNDGCLFREAHKRRHRHFGTLPAWILTCMRPDAQKHTGADEDSGGTSASQTQLRSYCRESGCYISTPLHLCVGVCMCVSLLSYLLLTISRVTNFLWTALISTAGLHQYWTEIINSAWLVSGLQIFVEQMHISFVYFVFGKFIWIYLVQV